MHICGPESRYEYAAERIYTPPDALLTDYPNLDTLLCDLAVDVVVGHLGYLRPGLSTGDEGFQALLRLIQTGQCWTKLTAPYRVSAGDLPYSSLAEFARRLVREEPERVL